MAAKKGSAGLRFVTVRPNGTFAAQVQRKKLKFIKEGFKTAKAAHEYAVGRIAAAGERVASGPVEVSPETAAAAKAALDGDQRTQFDCDDCGYSQATAFERCPKCSSFAIEKVVHGAGRVNRPNPVRPNRNKVAEKPPETETGQPKRERGVLRPEAAKKKVVNTITEAEFQAESLKNEFADKTDDDLIARIESMKEALASSELDMMDRNEAIGDMKRAMLEQKRRRKEAPKPAAPPTAAPAGDRYCMDCVHRDVCRIRDGYRIPIAQMLKRADLNEPASPKYLLAADLALAFSCGYFQEGR